jgi:hypothetical protein
MLIAFRRGHVPRRGNQKHNADGVRRGKREGYRYSRVYAR